MPALGKTFVISGFDTNLGPYNEDQPIPYVEYLSARGVLSIGWDRRMTQRKDYPELNPSRVAVPNQNPSYPKRSLIYRHEGWYTPHNSTAADEAQWLLILEALELQVVPGEYSDQQYLNLTWEVLSYSDAQIKLQLYFEYPNHVSEQIEMDSLEIYFWGVEWFKSDRGEPVRYGQRLEVPIIRQIDPELADLFSQFGDIAAKVALLAMLMTVIAYGRILPTWIFLNALQVVSHLPIYES